MTYSTLDDQRAGRWHIPISKNIREVTQRTAELVYDFNALRPNDRDKQRDLLAQILNPASGRCYVQQPFRVEYGVNTTIGEGAFLNYNATILDTAEVSIGPGAALGPNCQLITVGHPVDDVEMRAGGWEIAHPVVLKEGVWLGAGVTVLPGVTIGAFSVVGAGSVVTKDIPPRSVAVGNPARVLREFDPDRFERSQLPVDVPVDAFSSAFPAE